MIDLNAEDFSEVKKILKTYVPGYKIVAFGSRATQQAKRHSDLDLCVMSNEPLSLEDIATLKDAFSVSDLDIKVDIVDWAVTKDSFRSIINKNAIVIQEAEQVQMQN